MLHKLEFLKEEINKMIASDSYDKDELIRKSQKLDKYIVESMKEKLSNSHPYLKKERENTNESV